LVRKDQGTELTYTPNILKKINMRVFSDSVLFYIILCYFFVLILLYISKGDHILINNVNRANTDITALGIYSFIFCLSFIMYSLYIKVRICF